MQSSMFHRILLAVTVLVVVSSAVQTDDSSNRIGKTFPKSISSDDLLPTGENTRISNGSITKSYTLHHHGATYLSIHFKEFQFDEGCFLTLSDKNGTEEGKYTGLGRGNLGTFWGRHVKQDTMIITVECNDGGDGNTDADYKKRAHFVTDVYAAGFEFGDDGFLEDGLLLRGSRNLKICGEDDKRDAQCYQQEFPVAYEKGKTIARLVLPEGRGCTGFLVTNDHLLTAHHCLQTNEQALNTDYEFMYESSSGGCDKGGVNHYVTGHFVYDAEKLLAADLANDWVLIKLKGSPGEKFNYLELENRLADEGEQIYIPQHPGGRDKAFAILDTENESGFCEIQSNSAQRCYSKSNNPPDLLYTCDSEGVSSGAPVLSRNTNKVIGLHHCGGKGCRGNKAVPIIRIYNEITKYINSDKQSSVGPDDSAEALEVGLISASSQVVQQNHNASSEAETTSTSSQVVQCTDDSTFTHPKGYDFANCTWFQELPETNCAAFGYHDWADEGGKFANEACCACGGGIIEE